MAFDISDIDDEVTGEHPIKMPQRLSAGEFSERVLIDIEPHVFDRLRTYAEQHGMSIDDAADKMLADPTPLQVAIANLETLSKVVYDRTAERDAAVCVLASLVQFVRRVGGYMAPEDQDTLSKASNVLAKHGVLV